MKIMCKCDGMKQSDTPYMQDFAGFHSNAYGAGCSSFGSQTERPGTILTWVQLPGAVRDFFPGITCPCRLFCGVRTASACSQKHQRLCVHSQFQTLAAILIPLLVHSKMLHTLVAMSSTSVVAAVALPR